MTQLTITHILSVRDTRDYEEQGDRWVPVPGSGQIRSCTRCGRDHEIHAEVELSDGSTVIIGPGCARGSSTEVTSRIQSAASAAGTTARLSRQLVATRKALDEAQSAWSAILALPLPQEPQLYQELPGTGGTIKVYILGDATVWCLPGTAFDAERRTTLVNAWQMNHTTERVPANTRCARPIYDLEDADDCAAARRYLGLSTERMAQLAQVTEEELLQLERGEAPPSWPQIVQAIRRQGRGLFEVATPA